MNLQNNISLKSLNSFGVDVKAKELVSIENMDELLEVCQYITSRKVPYLIIGGGCNILFTKNFDGLIVKMEMKGIDVKKINENEIFVTAKAGENWIDFVLYCVSNGYKGLENLACIPGTVGAAPVQNIGAYGVEVKDLIYNLDAINIDNQEIITFSNQDCKFCYRESIFKEELKGKYIITSVTFKLSKETNLKVEYSAISNELKRLGITNPSSENIIEVVKSIRKDKLPDPSDIGSAGSFFKNPIVSIKKYKELFAEYPDIIAYEFNGGMKLGAGWMIDKCGFKGFRDGDAGVYSKQALVLVNYGNASGEEIINLANKIQNSVYQRFQVAIEPEVNIYR